MFSSIVVGTDGSDTAALAVELGTDLARHHGATLHLVTAVRSQSGGVSVPSGAVSAVDPTASSTYRRESARGVLEKTAKEIEDLDVRLHCEEGSPADVIVRAADEVGADVIVVGSKGMQGTRRILGSVPNSVAHRAGCHVLVAKTT